MSGVIPPEAFDEMEQRLRQLLMLEAAHADLLFTISLKRSTQNLDLSTTTPADHPIFQGGKADIFYRRPRGAGAAAAGGPDGFTLQKLMPARSCTHSWKVLDSQSQ
jgi:hypothetical protein